MKQGLNAVAAILLLASPGAAYPADDLTGLSLDALMEIEVTSVSKREQVISEIPSAVFVLTADDLRRSGARDVPDALRSVPGLEVSQIDNNTWAISVRGDNSNFANKLLVLVDGRSVYTPLFAGVYWGDVNVRLSDIQQIEVIRGPGGSIWGANAVNGVINIITKPAAETPGGLFELRAGSHLRPDASVRYGGSRGRLDYRVRATASELEQQRAPGGGPALDGASGTGVDLRVDWTGERGDAWSIDAAYQRNRQDLAFTQLSLTPPFASPSSGPRETDAGHVLATWERAHGEGRTTHLQGAYTRIERPEPRFDHTRDQVDLEWESHASDGANHWVWGGNYRYSADDNVGSPELFTVPAERTDHLMGAFVQLERALGERWLVNAGIKLEHNDYSGFEVQPSLRALRQVADNQRVWGAISRAVHTPSRAFHDIIGWVAVLPGAPPTLIEMQGSDALDAEEAWSAELGYRLLGASGAYVDVSAFWQEVDGFTTSEPSAPEFRATPVPHFAVPHLFDNRSSLESYGVEVAAQHTFSGSFRVRGSYSWLDMSLTLDPGSMALGLNDPIGDSPEHQLRVDLQFDLPSSGELDLYAHWVDEIPGQAVGSYTDLNVRLAYRLGERLALAVVGRHLLDDAREEFGSFLVDRSAIERTWYAELTWKF